MRSFDVSSRVDQCPTSYPTFRDVMDFRNQPGGGRHAEDEIGRLSRVGAEIAGSARYSSIPG